ncbi:hypothetical protein [Stigmatella hybrida]|uniref:hypothetical protein n=1 Tax=Stigmatella hybrida TaxID=394097 RepID=UPI001CDB0309|nr:hypothetical protein [Stigmatella hybrida]
MSAIVYPAEWKGRIVYTIDLLLFLREQVRKGVILDMFMGSTHTHALNAFIAGSEQALRHNGFPDREYSEFVAWLRDAKKDYPCEGWAVKYLRDCGGDHLAAIKKFLEFVAEFRETRRGNEARGL